MTFVKSKRCDTVFLQETHLIAHESKKLCRDWVGHVSASCGGSRSRGVVILSHKQLQFRCIRESGDEAGQVLLLFSELQGHKVILANVYAPNNDDPTFFGQLECKLNDMGDYPIIMGGDFNQVMDNILDRSTFSQHQCRSVSVMQLMSGDYLTHLQETIPFTPRATIHCPGLIIFLSLTVPSPQ